MNVTGKALYAAVFATLLGCGSGPKVTQNASSTGGALEITSVSLPSGEHGQSYTGSLSASGGTPDYTWSIKSGSLPDGLTLSPSDGEIWGVPTTVGAAKFTVAVSDHSQPANTQTVTTSIMVTPSALAISSLTLAFGQVGESYGGLLQASGGMAPYTWSVKSGTLPAGLSLSPSLGIISGIPLAAGTSTFTVAVTDSEALPQTQTVSTSVTVVPTPLTISSLGLSSGQVGQSFSGTVQASGGVSPYTWSIRSGSLPAGLSLSTATGAITGIPTVVGTSSFTLAVTDSEVVPQIQTVSTSLSIAPPPLTITSSALTPGQVGLSYSGMVQASGGVSPYTWSIPSGSLPAGLTLNAATGAIAGTPTVSGTFSFTAAVADSETPAQTQSVATTLIVASTQATAGTTWYVRTDGGTRYSANAPGQCDGKSDAPYPGSGLNQHCAFNDVRLLWQDGSYTTGGSFPGWGWVISGGDTVIIRGSISSGVTWRVGWSNSSSCIDSSVIGGPQARGLCGNNLASGMPPPPSGTASQHTRILGENYGSCHAAADRTQLHGGFGVGAVLALNGSSYVDVACLDVTDFSACGRVGQAKACNVNPGTLDDYATNGITFSNTTTNDTVTDVRVHGLASVGLSGSTGDGVTLSYIEILGNAGAGWNADAGDGTTGVGALNITNFNISWNGCAEEYPVVDALPYADCRDDSSGGYGDGFGTATVPSPAPGWQVHFDQGVASYNTQDGLDALHITGTGSSMTVTRTLAFGNMGQQIKVGGSAPTMINNVIVGNCHAMQNAIPGTPAGFNAHLGDFCRAANTAVLINVPASIPAVYQYNTLYSDNAVALEVEYPGPETGTETIQYNNNIFLGFQNTAGEFPSPIYSSTNLDMFTHSGASFSNNVFFHTKGNWACPHAGELNTICADPQLTDEAYPAYGYGNMTPLAGSVVKGKGIALPNVTVDYLGVTRATPPTIGAYD